MRSTDLTNLSRVYNPTIFSNKPQVNKVIGKHFQLTSPLKSDKKDSNKKNVNEVQPKGTNILQVDNTGCLFVNSINIQDNIIGVNEYGLLTMPDTAPPNKLVTSIHNRQSLLTHYPFALQNKKLVSKTNVYTVPLPVVQDIHVISILFSMEYTEYALNNVLAYNIARCNSYMFKSHFTYDSTWINVGKGIPNMPYTPILYPCEKSIHDSRTKFKLTYDNDNKSIQFHVTLPPFIYIVGTITIQLGQIYPRDRTLYDTFQFNIGVL